MPRLATVLIAALTPALFIAGCSAPDTNGADEVKADNGKINIYSSRHYDTDLALYDEFTEKTGIKVNRLEAGADALIERIKSEGEFSPADILVTVDAGRIWRAVEADLLSPVESEVLETRLAENMRHPEGLWFGLSKRARVVIYNKAAGLPEGLSRYEDLADPAFADMICMRSSGNIYNISLLASIVSHSGADAAEAWAQGVVDNFARRPQGNDTSQIEAVATGECGLSVVNSYYLARFAGSDNADLKATYDALGILFPNQGDRGTHVNISGAGVLKTAPNRENAIRFIEYLTEESAQSYFANGNNEYPAVEGVNASSAVESMGEFEEDTLNLSELGIHQAEAVRIFDRVGWP